MRLKSLLAMSVLVAFTLPALAATQYYVAQNVKTKKCSVVKKKPDGKKSVMIGESSYKTKAAATKALGESEKCKKKKA